MNLQYLPIQPGDWPALYRLYRDVLFEVISDAIGWDEAFQQYKFDHSFFPEASQWVVPGPEQNPGVKEHLGALVVNRYDQEMHVELLLIYPQYQHQGVGSQVLTDLKAQADSQHARITGSTYLNNDVALRTCKKAGFMEIGRTETMVDLGWQPAELSVSVSH